MASNESRLYTLRRCSSQGAQEGAQFQASQDLSVTSIEEAEERLISRQSCIREGDRSYDASSLLSEFSVSSHAESTGPPAIPAGMEGFDPEDKAVSDPPRENLKIAFSNKKRNVLYVAAIFHLPAMALTLVLIGLYISHATWPSPGPSNNILNSIQFAAKIHEGLAFGSITQIVFHRLRHELLGEHGLPFGLVTGAFQITSIPYFFSKQFWSPMRTIYRSPHQALTFTLLISALVLVSALGPSSAIVMMPRLGWSPVSMPALSPEDDRGQRVTRDIFIGSSYSDLYTSNISGDNSRLDVCTQWFATTGDYPAECPSSGWRDLVASLTALFLTTENKAVGRAESPVNLTVSGLVGSRVVTGNGLSWSNNSQENTIAYATTPSDFLMSALNWKSSEILGSEPSPQFRIRPDPPRVRENETASWLQPFVVVQCSSNATDIIYSKNLPNELDPSLSPSRIDFNIDNIPFSFLKGTHKPQNISLSTAHINEKFAAALNATFTESVQADFIHLDDQLDPPGSSAMIFTTVYNGVFQKVDLCIAETSWIESDVELVRNATASPVPSSRVHFDLGAMLNDTSSKSRPVINLGMDWIESLNQLVPVIGNLDGGGEVRFFDYIASFCSLATLKQRCQSVFAASFLADAISRSQNVHPSVYLSKNGSDSGRDYHVIHSAAYTQGSNAAATRPLDADDLEDADLYTNIPFVISKYTYGYRLDNLTVVLAMAVLLLHMALVIVHVLIGLCGSSWSSMAWSGLGELLALGIQSDRTPLLKNTGAGISESSVWRLKTAIRELESEQRLQLVLQEQSNIRHQPGKGISMGLLPKADREYG